MTARPTVTRYAPGKLFITGEYAVMEPGNPAVLVAVDRLVKAAVSDTDTDTDTGTGTGTGGIVVCSDLCAAPVHLQWRGLQLVGRTPADERSARSRLAHVVSAVEVIAELLAQRGSPTPAFNLAISSELHENGTKLGLGSSGAVTVAVIAATAGYCGLELTRDEQFRLAMIASARLDIDSSGADLAASTFRGWIVYQAPDRAAVLELVRRNGIEHALRAAWPGLAVRRLAVPDGLTLQVGWTARPVSTPELIAGRNTREWRGSPLHRAFVADMTRCVRSTVRALEQGDIRSVLCQVGSARRLLAKLDEATGLGIFTDELVALCEAADALGAAAKPSGAGGGDCGIAILDTADGPDIAELQARWAAVGVRPLRIGVIDDGTDPT